MGRRGRKPGSGARRWSVAAGAALAMLAAVLVGPTPAQAGPVPDEGSDGKIVFVSWLQVYTQVLDGSDPELIVPQDGPAFGAYPEWSPGGTQIALNYDDEIHVMNPDGSGRYRVSLPGEFVASTPSWSPDAQRLAWSSGGDIVVADADDGANRTVIEPPDFDLSYRFPILSPDGTEVAVMVQDSGQGVPYPARIAIVPATGGAPFYVTDGPNDSYPQWSPDGTEIAYEGADSLGSNDEVRIVSEEGGDYETITPTDRSFRITDWAPNDVIWATEVIDTGSSDDRHIYRMNSDGTGLELMQDMGDNSGAADWASTACTQHPFSDVAAWVDAAVDWAWCGQYLGGYPDGTFRGHLDITRAQVANFLYKVAESPDMSGAPAPPWPDTPNWISDAAKWIAQNDYMDGYPNGDFGPDRPITRGQVIRLLWRIAGEPEAPAHSFSDVPNWLTGAVNWGSFDADGEGPGEPLVGGYPNNTFRDTNNITRNQTVRMVCRANTTPGTC